MVLTFPERVVCILLQQQCTAANEAGNGRNATNPKNLDSEANSTPAAAASDLNKTTSNTDTAHFPILREGGEKRIATVLAHVTTACSLIRKSANLLLIPGTIYPRDPSGYPRIPRSYLGSRCRKRFFFLWRGLYYGNHIK